MTSCEPARARSPLLKPTEPLPPPPMRLITSSLRTQLFAGFLAVQAVFAIGVVVAIVHVSNITSTVQTGTSRVKMVDALGTDTYDMQSSQLMEALDDGSTAADHAGDVQRSATALPAL